MTRAWEKIEEGHYVLKVEGSKVGEMHIKQQAIDSQADCQINGVPFTIHRTGFWKSTVEVLDQDGKIIAKTYSEKWYANSSILENGSNKYKLLLHNNPLAELAIMDGQKTLLAYGLNADKGKINITTTGEMDHSSFVLEFLLWYLFAPIAAASMGDDFIFHMLLTAQ